MSKNKNCLWLELLTAEHQSRRDFFAHDRNPEAIRENIDREFPSQGTKILQAMWCCQRKKEINRIGPVKNFCTEEKTLNE